MPREPLRRRGRWYRTPLIGRKLFGFVREAGLRDVKVQVLSGDDTRGYLAPVVFNMASYAGASGRALQGAGPATG